MRRCEHAIKTIYQRALAASQGLTTQRRWIEIRALKAAQLDDFHHGDDVVITLKTVGGMALHYLNVPGNIHTPHLLQASHQALFTCRESQQCSPWLSKEETCSSGDECCGEERYQ